MGRWLMEMEASDMRAQTAAEIRVVHLSDQRQAASEDASQTGGCCHRFSSSAFFFAAWLPHGELPSSTSTSFQLFQPFAGVYQLACPESPHPSGSSSLAGSGRASASGRSPGLSSTFVRGLMAPSRLRSSRARLPSSCQACRAARPARVPDSSPLVHRATLRPAASGPPPL